MTQSSRATSLLQQTLRAVTGAALCCAAGCRPETVANNSLAGTAVATPGAGAAALQPTAAGRPSSVSIPVGLAPAGGRSGALAGDAGAEAKPTLSGGAGASSPASAGIAGAAGSSTATATTATPAAGGSNSVATPAATGGSGAPATAPSGTSTPSAGGAGDPADPVTDLLRRLLGSGGASGSQEPSTLPGDRDRRQAAGASGDAGDTTVPGEPADTEPQTRRRRQRDPADNAGSGSATPAPGRTNGGGGATQAPTGSDAGNGGTQAPTTNDPDAAGHGGGEAGRQGRRRDR